MSARYAIFFAPERQSPWHQFGAEWLGRDEHNNSELVQPKFTGITSAEFALLTEEPRRYGFHATLKAPFRLALGVKESAAIAQLHTVARHLKPILLGPLRATTMGSFLVLVPETTPEGLNELAAACVTELDSLRAPLNEKEMARRLSAPLDARDMQLLEKYGYPYVLERYQLHFTLTGPAAPAILQRVGELVAPSIAQLNAAAALWLDRLCLFVERSPGEKFHRIADVQLRP